MRSTCLVRALVAARMLERFGYRADVVVGVPRETAGGEPWHAHAWVDIDPPGPGVQGYDELARIRAGSTDARA